jgi:hypothetical protein
MWRTGGDTISGEEHVDAEGVDEVVELELEPTGNAGEAVPNALSAGCSPWGGDGSLSAPWR